MKRFFQTVLAFCCCGTGILIALRLSSFLSSVLPADLTPNFVLWLVVMKYGIYLPGLLLTVMGARWGKTVLVIPVYAAFAIGRQLWTFLQFRTLYPSASILLAVLLQLGCIAAMTIQGISMTRISRSLVQETAA